MSENMSSKAKLRREVRSRLARMPPSERYTQSEAICSRLEFPPKARVALFAGMQTEVQLLSLLSRSEEIHWHLPRILNKSELEFLPAGELSELKKNSLGIMEPHKGLPAKTLDYIVCPGLAFTPQGGRLGQGGGYYDRALLSFPDAQLLGVCFKCQLLKDLPLEKHDLKMGRIITAAEEF